MQSYISSVTLYNKNMTCYLKVLGTAGFSIRNGVDGRI